MELSEGERGMDTRAWSELLTMEMELVGWAYIKDKEPDEDNVKAVERVLYQKPTCRASSFLFCKGGAECERFLDSGNQVRTIVESYFQMNFSSIQKQGPAIVRFESGTSDQELRPMRAHPTRDMCSLSIFRPLGQRADWKTGVFKLYPSSYSPMEEEFDKSSEEDAHEVVLETHELLVIAGSLYIQPSPNSGGQIVWQGFSKRPMYKDIDSPLALPFMKI